jgi:hypothetical protein
MSESDMRVITAVAPDFASLIRATDRPTRCGAIHATERAGSGGRSAISAS